MSSNTEGAVREINGLLPSSLRLASIDSRCTGRLSILDATKGLAACVIVAHHLTYYGRAADVAMEIVPGLIRFLYSDARMIVQLFMVLGGFGLAWSSSRKQVNWTWTWAFQTVLNRYLRLFFPYAIMLCVLIGVARMLGELRPGNPMVESISWGQLLAHSAFLQNLMGFENLSAGIWYLCIDLQFAILFCLLGALIATFCKRFQGNPSPINLLATVFCVPGTYSAMYWNRIPDWDYSIVYFLSTFVLGALVGWERSGHISARTVLMYGCLLLLSLCIDFRPRLMVALLSAVLLWLSVRLASHWQMPRPFVWLGKISYSLFVIHYTVCSFLIAILDGWIGTDPVRAVSVMMLAFFASIAAGALLFYGIEQPILRWLSRKQIRQSPNITPGSLANAPNALTTE